MESPLDPEVFVPMHPGETIVTAVTENVSKNYRRYQLFLDAIEISQWSEGLLKAGRKIDMNNLAMKDMLALFSASGKAPLKVNDGLYLDADYSIYRG